MIEIMLYAKYLICLKYIFYYLYLTTNNFIRVLLKGLERLKRKHIPKMCD